MHRTSEQIADTIGAFLKGDGSAWDWDDFISISIDDARLDRIRRLCSELPDLYPPEHSGAYCGERGLEILGELRNELQGK
jgi:hypothetical protein